MKQSLVKEFTKKNIVQELAIAIQYVIFIILSLIGPYMMKYFIDDIIPSKDTSKMFLFVAVFIEIYLLMGFLGILIKYSVAKLEHGIVTEIRDKMFTNMIYQPLSFYREHQLGQVSERLMRDTAAVHSIWGYLLPSIFSSIVLFLASFVIIMKQSLLMAVLSLLSILIYLFVFKLYNEKLRAMYMDTRKDVDQINVSITDAWNGSKEIKIFQLETLMIGRFLKLNQTLKKHNQTMEVKEELSNQLMSFATILGTLVTLIVGGYLVMNGKMTIGILVALQAYVAKLYKPAENMADMAVDYKKYQINIQRMNQLYNLDWEEDVKQSDVIFRNTKVQFHQVHFTYGNHPVLKDITFATPEKGIIALVGKSGAGKTTMVNILMGFLKPTEGTVYIGDTNIIESSKKNLRNFISIASQDAYLFHMSVYENIKLGNPNATEEEINRVIHLLEIDQIVNDLPDKLDTVIAEMGKNISGGQLQRIAIARALLKKTPIIILDEATSNVDSNSELIIQNVLEYIKRETLIIMISHRLSSLKKAEKIFVLESGKIVEEGKFNELIGKDGAFRKLFSEQLL